MNEYILPQNDSATKPVIRCEFCNEYIHDPVENAALAWHGIFLKDGFLYTNFSITHKTSQCINGHLGRVELVLWMPFSTFYKDGQFNLDWFLVKRYDDYGNQIDADLQIDMDSLNRVSPLMELLAQPVIVAEKPVTRKRGQTKIEGFVYLIQSPTGAYKIGRTSNPENRLKTFNVKLPFEIEFLTIISTPNMRELEAQLHNKFASKRINGEWFELSPEDVEYIKGLTK